MGFLPMSVTGFVSVLVSRVALLWVSLQLAQSSLQIQYLKLSKLLSC